jgi:hypothetical protein
MKKNNKLGKLVAGSVISSYLLVGGVAMAAGPQGFDGRMGGRAPGLIGTVSAINGTTLTVTDKGRGVNATATTYAVDASTATVSKNGATSSLSNVAVGDTVMIVGKTSGTNVTATSINDGVMGRGMAGGKMGQPGQRGVNNIAPVIEGNGMPVVAGTISAINGSTLTITNKSNVTYTVDASKAKIAVKNVVSTISGVTVGDSVVVQGTVNGNSVAASSVMDNGVIPNMNTFASSTPKVNHGGFFGGIGDFFHGLFGF